MLAYTALVVHDNDQEDDLRDREGIWQVDSQTNDLVREYTSVIINNDNEMNRCSRLMVLFGGPVPDRLSCTFDRRMSGTAKMVQTI